MSRLITGVSASQITNRRITRDSGIPHDRQIYYMLYQTELDGKTHYCCWSGGKMENGEVMLTQVGQAALETLLSLPVGKNKTLVMQELKLGPTPLRDKVKITLRKLPSGSLICFYGDMSGELDGHMHEAFNVVGNTTLSPENAI